MISVLVEDAVTATILDEIPFRAVTFGSELCAAGGWSARLDGRHPRIIPSAIRPGATIVHILDDVGVPTFSGMCWAADWEDGQVRAAGQGLWSVFGEVSGRDRVYRGGTGGMSHASSAAGGGVQWVGVDQLLIAEDLIGWAHADPGGSVGMTVRRHPAGGSGVARDVTIEPWERASIGATIEGLAASDTGFEFRAGCEWVAGTLARYLDLWYPRLGHQSATVWEHGADIRIDSMPVRAGANRVDALGAGSDAAKIIRSASATPAGTLRHDRVISRTDIADGDLLQAAADGELARYQPGAATMRFELDVARWPFGTWSIGDEIRVVADDGWCQSDGTTWWRIMAWDATCDRAGNVSVVVDAAAGAPTGRPLLLPAAERTRRDRDLARRVARLEGR